MNPENENFYDHIETYLSARSILTPTEQYIADNEYVNRLERFKNTAKGVSFHPYSISHLMHRKLKDLTGIPLYLRELLSNLNWAFKTYNIRGLARGKTALVLGNGPSQGYLSKKQLEQYVENSGDVFTVNFWNINKRLSDVSPAFLTISDPNTLNFDIDTKLTLEKNKLLREYLHKNESIKIICPLARCNDLAKQFGENRTFGFIDTSLRFWCNFISPLLPRGYASLTLYKTLAFSLWLGYERIYVLGMDNTYPRSIYCDQANNILRLETHAGDRDFVSELLNYESVSHCLAGTSFSLYDLRLFAQSNRVFNLDPYSLTDAFSKRDISVLTSDSF